MGDVAERMATVVHGRSATGAGAGSMPEVDTLEAATLAALITLVHKHTGIAMNPRKSVLLQGRLRPRLRALGLPDYQAYLDRVGQDAAEVPMFVNMVTTNDTAFFRTAHVWAYFVECYLPQWVAIQGGKPLKIWSAAAASGEEAYSIAMLCQEFQRRHPVFRYQIFATDISTAVLATAKAGVYGGRSVERIMASHPALFAKYFTGDARQARIAPALTVQICFAEHNLLTSLTPHDSFDLVFLRNVLIYFEADVQKKVVDLLMPNLRQDGRLILGESESLARLSTGYRMELPLVYGIAQRAR